MAKKNRNIRNRFYIGSIVQKRSVNSDGIKTEVVCLYNTIAYKDSDTVYYDFVGNEEVKEFDLTSIGQMDLGTSYFVSRKNYFDRSCRRYINNQEIQKLFLDIENFSFTAEAIKKQEQRRVRK